MTKILAFTLKELTLVFRDRTGLLLMLVAPLALTALMGFAFSNVNTGGLAPIEVVIVNQDEGPLGQQVLEALEKNLSDLLTITLETDAAAARQMIDDDQAAAAVILPTDLSARIMAAAADESTTIEIYANPGRPIGAGVVKTVFARFIQQMTAARLGTSVTIEQLIHSGRLAPQDAGAVAEKLGGRVAEAFIQRQLVTVQGTTVALAGEGQFNFLAYYAPSIAIMFLMFTMAGSARSLLNEKEIGTLARLRSTPTTAGEILGGKISGVFFVGLTQMTILIFATHFMGVRWGDPLAVGVFTALVVAAIGALGLVIASIAQSHAQANVIGSAVVMILSAVGGSFLPRAAYPEWLRTLSLIGPNAWGIEGFQKLTQGATLGDLGGELLALTVMTVVFFSIALVGFRRLVR